MIDIRRIQILKSPAYHRLINAGYRFGEPIVMGDRCQVAFPYRDNTGWPHVEYVNEMDLIESLEPFDLAQRVENALNQPA